MNAILIGEEFGQLVGQVGVGVEEGLTRRGRAFRGRLEVVGEDRVEPIFAFDVGHGVQPSSCSRVRSFFRPAPQQSGDGRLGALQSGADVGHGDAAQVVHLDDDALVFRQLGQGAGQAQEVFLTADPLAGRRLVGGQPRLDAGRRGVHALFQRRLHVQLALVLASGVDQRVGQDAAQPAGLFGLGAAAELAAVLVGLDQRLLHHVRRVELAAQPRVELEPREQVEVVAVVLHRTIQAAGRRLHNGLMEEETGANREPTARVAGFPGGAGPQTPGRSLSRTVRSCQSAGGRRKRRAGGVPGSCTCLLLGGQERPPGAEESRKDRPGRPSRQGRVVLFGGAEAPRSLGSLRESDSPAFVDFQEPAGFTISFRKPPRPHRAVRHGEKAISPRPGAFSTRPVRQAKRSPAAHPHFATSPCPARGGQNPPGQAS